MNEQTDKQIEEKVEVKALIEKSKLEYIKDNLTEGKKCSNCKHIEGCMLELSKEHINPDEYVCSNFERQGDKKWIKN